MLGLGGQDGAGRPYYIFSLSLKSIIIGDTVDSSDNLGSPMPYINK